MKWFVRSSGKISDHKAFIMSEKKMKINVQRSDKDEAKNIAHKINFKGVVHE